MFHENTVCLIGILNLVTGSLQSLYIFSGSHLDSQPCQWVQVAQQNHDETPWSDRKIAQSIECSTKEC